VERATHYELTPLLYANLEPIADSTWIPPEVMAQLKVLAQWHAFYNMNLYGKLQEVLNAFSQQRIPVIVLKGAALAALVYEDISLRSMKDLDLLVRGEDLDAADRLLRTLRYVPNESHHSQAWYREHHHHLAPYVAQDHSLVLELHHHILPPTIAERIPIHTLWQRAQPAQIISMTTLVLAPEDLLLHLSLHLVGDICINGVGKLRALRDIAEIISRYKESIDWEHLLREAKTYEVEKHLYYAFWLTQDIIDAEVPIQILRDLKPTKWRQSFEDRCLKYFLRKAVLDLAHDHSPIPAWVLSYTCFQLLRPVGAGKKIGAICRRLWQEFVRSAQQTVTQPRILIPLYTLFIHPFYLLVRVIGRFAR
jgi:hypothetical protein